MRVGGGSVGGSVNAGVIVALAGAVALDATRVESASSTCGDPTHPTSDVIETTSGSVTKRWVRMTGCAQQGRCQRSDAANRANPRSAHVRAARVA
jgi:hypothetical protein